MTASGDGGCLRFCPLGNVGALRSVMIALALLAIASRAMHTWMFEEARGNRCENSRLQRTSVSLELSWRCAWPAL